MGHSPTLITGAGYDANKKNTDLLMLYIFPIVETLGMILCIVNPDIMG